MEKENNDPLVSVIVPIYNAANYLSLCIESIQRQSYNNLEIILINDGSTDDSEIICEQIGMNDSRVYYKKVVNSGVSAARNEGLKVANGDFICFVDADDHVHQDYISTSINIFKSNVDIDLVYFGHYLNYNGKMLLKSPRLSNGMYTYENLRDFLIDDGTLTGILFGSACLAMYKKELITNYNILFNEELSVNEDGIFNIQYCKISKVIYVNMESAFYYYRQETKKVSNVNRKIQELHKATEYLDSLDAMNNIQRYRRQFSEVLWITLEICKLENKDANFRGKKAMIDGIISKYDLVTAYEYLDFNKLNKYKKIYSYLLLRKKFKILILLNEYIIPILNKYIKR